MESSIGFKPADWARKTDIVHELNEDHMNKPTEKTGSKPEMKPAGKKTGFDIGKLKAQTAERAKQFSAADQQVQASVESTRQRPIGTAQVAELPLDQIRLRHGGDTRPLRGSHVVDLATSIAIFGLSQPPAVDAKYRLLAGGHRLMALRLLAANKIDRVALLSAACPEVAREPATLEALEDLPATPFTKAIPVRVFEDLDSETDPGRAQAIEITENEKRRDYSREDVIAMAEKFRAAGYTFSKGRPGPGEKPGMQHLALICGKHRSTIFRMLQDQPAAQKSTGKPVAGGEEILRLVRIRRDANDQETLDALAVEVLSADRVIAFLRRCSDEDKGRIRAVLKELE